MKIIRLLPLCLLLTGASLFAATFPGLQSVMTEAEWKRAGLDRLTPDQIGVIDAAVIRHAAGAPRPVPAPTPPLAVTSPVAATPPARAAVVPPPAAAEPARPKPSLLGRLGLSKSRDEAPPARTAPVEPVAAPESSVAAAPAEPARARAGILERFGLSKSSGDDWRSQPPVVARFVMWQGANRFLLDNGQVWEGLEQIVLALAPGREVTIEARPLNGFALKLDERSAIVRVQRVK